MENQLLSYEVKYFEDSRSMYMNTKVLKGFTKNHVRTILLRKYPNAVISRVKEI